MLFWVPQLRQVGLCRNILYGALILQANINFVVFVCAAVFVPRLEQSSRMGGGGDLSDDVSTSQFAAESQGLRLNEWGALLLHDFVMEAVDEMEIVAAAECDTSVR
jgi:hypothetical protein